MADSQELEWRLIARDEATKVYKDLAQAQREVAKTTKDAAAASKETSSSWQEVFKGVAAWDALKSAVHTAVEFLGSSIEESMNASATMAQVKQNVQNAGLSYDALADKIKAAGDAAIQKGFDDEEASSSLSKLMLVTKNYDQAVKLNNLSMDLARSKNISLTEASALVTQVTQGNNKVLKQYGIELDDNADAADNLAKLQDKLKGSAEAYANTTAGKLAIVKEQWSNVKQAVGDELTPVMAEFMQGISDNMPAITSLVVSFAQALATVGGAIIDVANAWNVWAGSIDDVQKIDKKLVSNLDSVADAFNKSNEKIGKGLRLTGEEIAKMDLQTQKSLIKKYGKDALASAADTEKASLTFQSSFKGIGVASTAASDARAKVKDAMGKLGDDYRDAATAADESLAKLEKSHEDATATISAKLADLQGKLKDLAATYKDTMASMNQNEAERVVAQEGTIADLKKQIAEAQAQPDQNDGDRAQTAALVTRLQQEQAAYDAYVAGRKGLDDELTEARRRASETQFQRDIEDINKRRTEAETDHQKKLDDLNTEVAAQTEAQAKEDAIYAAKREQYDATLAAFGVFHDGYLKGLGDMKDQTQQSVDEMRAKLEEMKRTLSEIESTRNAIKTAQQVNVSAAAGASGSPGKVTAGAGNVELNIDLGGVTVASGADEDRLIQKMVDAMKRQFQLAGLASG